MLIVFFPCPRSKSLCHIFFFHIFRTIIANGLRFYLLLQTKSSVCDDAVKVENVMKKSLFMQFGLNIQHTLHTYIYASVYSHAHTIMALHYEDLTTRRKAIIIITAADFMFICSNHVKSD